MNEAALQGISAIVIGTSAGGVHALGMLLSALPENMRAAVLVVIHLPPDKLSLMPELFSPRCAVPVCEALDKEPIVPGTIYFAPPDYHLLVDAGPQIALSADEAVNYSRPSIDVLFESAADIYRERLLGILLTGGSPDGAAGLLAIQQAGGLTMVQDPETAEVPCMPLAALEILTPDFIFPLEHMASLLKGLPGGDLS